MRPVARIAVALVLTIVWGGCSVTRPVSRTVQRPSGPSRYVLPNGVPVIVEEHRASDVVALQLWVQAGARDESARELGLAHYLEHMLFKGTPTRPVVLEEMRLNDDNPRRFLVRELFTAAFEGHPYGRPVIGSADVISALSRETLVGFYRRHYAPEMFALVVVGAVDPDEVLRVARATLGGLSRSGTRRLPPPLPPAPRAVRLELTRPSGQAHLGLAWHAPRLDHADTPALDLLMSILGRTKASRLVAALREREGIVNSISSGLTALEGAGLVTITAQLEPQNLERAEAEVLAEIQRVRDRGVTVDELRRGVTAAEVDHEFSTETAEGRARAYGQAETIWRLQEELIYLDRLRTVSAAQVQSVARRYLDPTRYVRVALVPPRS